MEVDPSDSVKCSLSFTYSSGETETKVVVGAEAMMAPTSRGRNDQFYAELTHVSIADEYVTRSQLDVCTLTHYFNLNQLNRRYHDVWRPSKYGYEATKEGCQQYIKQIGTYAFEKGKMKEQWKAIQVPRTPSYATDKPRFKALFGIAVEAIKYHRVSGRDAIGAYTKSEELHEMLGVDVTGPRSELERITTHLTTNPKGMCHDKLPSIDVEALKEAQRVETIPHRNPDERMRLNVGDVKLLFHQLLLNEPAIAAGASSWSNANTLDDDNCDAPSSLLYTIMVHHPSIIILLLLATAPCSVASTAAMAKDTTDSATCSLSFTYTKDNTETKVIVGAEAMMLPPPAAAAEEGKKEEFYAELTYVSMAEERQFVTPLSPTPQKDGMIIHYFNLHDLDARYHDVWDPSMYGNKRAIENECKKYIKAIGNEQLRRHHAKLDDEWKNITITKPARDKPL
ncbi:hypothetical protein FOZ63_032380 [Perkinsus olseni]|uniref:Uncharacterized protein n=1 Tax=Perkinsus olseni TaxID=32597 RepID=A0A7J6UC78_PEROL|nr:hypothetical protein FOZ63_032380 [Perkinsus olseni]